MKATAMQHKERKTENSWRLPVLVAVFVAGSASMIFAQFVLHKAPWLHHAFFCALVFITAVFSLRQAKGRILTRAGLVYALLGMSLGVFELVRLLLGYHH